jgi:DNA primase small subunit
LETLKRFILSKVISTVDQITKVYLSRKFEEYYSKAKLNPPPDFERREWAFVPFDSLPNFVMHRHIAFTTPDMLKSHILTSVPAHIFYSSAHYVRPDEDAMEKKGWLYADLIFDIDADHLPLKNKNMENALRVAKREIIRLTEILQRDFGVDEKDMKIVFSGGRGYHIHVYDENLRNVRSPERREIVDYISVNEPAVSATEMIASTQSKRIMRCVLRYFINLRKRGKLSDLFLKYGIKGKTAENIQLKLNRILSDRNLAEQFIEGKLKISRSKRFTEMLDWIISVCVAKNSIHVDAPVTADIKRLIRFPGSLHGKSGLMTMEVSLNDIDKFNPLNDAIAFGDEKVKVRILPLKGKMSVSLRGETFTFRSGEKVKVPEFVAVHLLCRGIAKYGH